MSRRRTHSQTTKRSNKNLSQMSVEPDISDDDMSEHAHNVVRYILFKAGESGYIGKNDIHKNVMSKSGKYFQSVMEKVTLILHKSYGFNLLSVDSKGYILSNALPYISIEKDTENNEEIPEDANKILLLLILSHIFMSTESVTEASVHGFLSKLGIDVNVRHEVFENVKDCITLFIKQKYLKTEEDATNKKLNYTWGIRSEKEISKLKVLEFVCKMFNGAPPEKWEYQYSVAQNQFENNTLVQNDDVENDS